LWLSLSLPLVLSSWRLSGGGYITLVGDRQRPGVSVAQSFNGLGLYRPLIGGVFIFSGIERWAYRRAIAERWEYRAD
jgi:fucose permease